MKVDVNIFETDPDYISDDEIVELSYQFECDGVIIRKSWIGLKSDIPRSIEIDDIEPGEIVTFSFETVDIDLGTL